MKDAPKTIIIGAGLAGLACACRLHQDGHEVTILEASDGPGGRVRTDEVDGFLLDRGFQVYLSAYPEAGKLLDLEALKLLNFRSGALVRKGGKLHRVMDVFRHPGSVFTSALAPIGSLRDKLLVAKMRFGAKRSTVGQIEAREDLTTEERLRGFGFSEQMIDGFFRVFYGGIFLERDLRTSARMFDFTFKMFAEGQATVPSKGMGEIPKQLVSRLPRGTVRYRSAVKSISGGTVILENGESHVGDRVVVATDASTAAQLCSEIVSKPPDWRSTVTLYFSAKKTPLHEEIIALNGDGDGLINNVCVISDVAPLYSPVGQALISVSVLGMPEVDDLEAAVLAELEKWFGAQAKDWKHLRSYHLKQALPEQPPVDEWQDGFKQEGQVFACGDYCMSASIEGAIRSGLAVAKAIARQQAHLNSSD